MWPRVAGVILILAGVGFLRVDGGVASAILAEGAGDSAAELLYQGVVPTRDGVRRIVESRTESLRRADRPRAHRDLAMVALLEAERIEQEAEAAEAARSAVQRFVAGLSLAPADIIGWSMVPFAALGRGEVGRAVGLVAVASRIVPYTPDFALNRVAALLAADIAKDDRASALLARELAVAVRHHLEATARLVRERGQEEFAIAQLAGEPELSIGLSRAIEELVEQPEVE